ncbi:MAG: hypothetical protein QXE51_02730 [Nitrososphaeria archaeon]
MKKKIPSLKESGLSKRQYYKLYKPKQYQHWLKIDRERHRQKRLMPSLKESGLTRRQYYKKYKPKLYQKMLKRDREYQRKKRQLVGGLSKKEKNFLDKFSLNGIWKEGVKRLGIQKMKEILGKALQREEIVWHADMSFIDYVRNEIFYTQNVDIFKDERFEVDIENLEDKYGYN